MSSVPLCHFDTYSRPLNGPRTIFSRRGKYWRERLFKLKSQLFFDADVSRAKTGCLRWKLHSQSERLESVDSWFHNGFIREIWPNMVYALLEDRQ